MSKALNTTGHAGPCKSPVAKRSKLQLADLQDLFSGQRLAIVIPQYFDAKTVAALAKRIEQSGQLGAYSSGLNSNEVLKIGQTLYECDTPEKVAEYFALAKSHEEPLRYIAAGLPLPIDRVIEDLNYLWPKGAGVLKIDGQRTFAGLLRGFNQAGEARPHTDRADWDLPTPTTLALKGQFAGNLYLSNPRGGGALQLWWMKPDRSTYQAMQVSGDYSLQREILGRPAAVIHPKPGDLVLFNAWRPHAVTASTGLRIAQSWFVGYRGESQALGLFS
ncbi:MAG: hypothetical protein V3W41_13990 [Planctomycetota bacterium]